MATKKIKFTSTHAVDAFEVGDNTIDIIGYVDGLESLKYVGAGPKALLKFIINNNDGRRIKVLFWGETAKKYETKIQNGVVLHLKHCLYQAANLTFYRKEENIVPYELTFLSHSEIEFLGKHVAKAPITNKKIISTTIKDCIGVEGKIRVEGFMKTALKKVTTGYSTYGSGAIMEGIHKIRLHVCNYIEKAELVEGAHVMVIGEVKKDAKFNLIYMHIESVEDIEIIDDKILPYDELQLGIHTPSKRPANQSESDKENESATKKK